MKFRRVVAALLVLVVVLSVGAFFAVWQTLPGMPKEVRGLGLKANAHITFDTYGVPTLRASSEHDLMRLQGYVLARDRFFQMDLIRRRTAGRLAEILGPKLVPVDELRRRYGFQRVAERAITLMTPERKAVLDAYAEGVNAFLEQGPTPPEIVALGYRPDRWKAADCVLVVLGMFDPPPTNDETNTTAALARVPRALIDFLATDYGFLDAPMMPSATDPKGGAVPPASVFDSKAVAKKSSSDASPSSKPPVSTRGSNAWAIAGSRTKSGIPLLAGDPHLELNVPNIWYRLRLEGAGYEVTGVTLGGIPGIILGSNGRVAWTMTNPFADQIDRVVVPASARREKRSEVIRVKDSPETTLVIEDTEWGPVMEDGFALQWVALDPEPLSRMDVLELNRAADLPSTLLALSHWTGPAQNALFATKDGHIGWTVIGSFPERLGFDGSASVTRDANHRWLGYYAFSEYPKIIDPPSGFLLNSNQRAVPVDKKLHQFGRDWPSSNRASLLRKTIEDRRDWTVDAFRPVQLDLHSLTHLWYRDRLVEAAAGATGDDARWLTAIRAIVEPWDGSIPVDSKAYPIVREFRTTLQATLLEPVLDVIRPPMREAARELWFRDTTVKTLLEQKPQHWLPASYADYGALVRDAAVRAAKTLVKDPTELAALHWGAQNRARIQHPFALILPASLGFIVNMPADEQPGDIITVRSATPVHGASMRMIVDLGDRAASIFAQPAGQSGHFLSSHYRDQHAGWAKGEYQSFEPSAAVATIAFAAGTGVN